MIEYLEEAIRGLAESNGVVYNADLPLRKMFPMVNADELELRVTLLAEQRLDDMSGGNMVEFPPEIGDAIENLSFADWLSMVEEYADGFMEDLELLDEEELE